MGNPITMTFTKGGQTMEKLATRALFRASGGQEMRSCIANFHEQISGITRWWMSNILIFYIGAEGRR